VPMADFNQELSDRLDKVSLSTNEAKIFDIAQGDIKLSNEECNRSLFGKIIGGRPASWIGIKRAMSQIWKLNHPMEVKELCPNYFQFIFQNRGDMKKVANGTNWSFENQYIILKEWEASINNKNPGFQELNLWVQVQNIPLNWISTEVGLKIGQAFNKVKNMVIATTGNHRGKILKLLVTLNVNEPLPRMAKVRLGDQLVNVGFKYEKLINLCHYCGKLGHLDRGCLKKMEDIRNNSLQEGQYGDWMRAADGFRGSTFSLSGSRSSPPPKSLIATDNGTSKRASSSHLIRKTQREEMLAAKQKWGSLWFSIGDCNDILSNSEKSGGTNRPTLSLLGFNSFVSEMDMLEVQSNGYAFTWSNNRAPPALVEEKLDRAFGSLDWSHSYPNAVVSNTPRSSSDHSALLLSLGLPQMKRKAIFHFDKRWLSMDGFNDIVTAAWKSPVTGTPFFQLKERVKNTRIAILIW
ncbi:Unknown protein, partial [Striga hermonthica]